MVSFCTVYLLSMNGTFIAVWGDGRTWDRDVRGPQSLKYSPAGHLQSRVDRLYPDTGSRTGPIQVHGLSWGGKAMQSQTTVSPAWHGVS